MSAREEHTYAILKVSLNVFSDKPGNDNEEVNKTTKA